MPNFSISLKPEAEQGSAVTDAVPPNEIPNSRSLVSLTLWFDELFFGHGPINNHRITELLWLENTTKIA